MRHCLIIIIKLIKATTAARGVKTYNKIFDEPLFVSKYSYWILKSSKSDSKFAFINKNFSNLSGGEKQRIILARALYKNSSILILDEALSEVNKDLEIDIITKLNLKFKNKTIIYVTHKDYEKYFDEVLEIGGANAWFRRFEFCL